MSARDCWELEGALLETSFVDARELERLGPGRAFLLGADLGALAALLIGSQAPGRDVEVMIAPENVKRAGVLAHRLGAWTSTTYLPVSPCARARFVARF